MAKFIVRDFKDSIACAILEKLGIDETYVRRLILDLPAGGVGMVYLETYADSEVLKIDTGRLTYKIYAEGDEGDDPVPMGTA